LLYATDEKLKAAERVIERVAVLISPLIEKYKPNHHEAMAIKESVNNYLETK
jgi:hypothetical protein